MIEVERISLLPIDPAVYAMLGGPLSNRYVAYVGVADKLQRRVAQHLERRDSSVTTGAAVVSLKPEHVTEVQWWINPAFADRVALEAAELVAFEVLVPILRSRGRIRSESLATSEQPAFRAQMQAFFGGSPTGRLILPTLQDALDRIAKLEERIKALELSFADERQ